VGGDGLWSRAYRLGRFAVVARSWDALAPNPPAISARSVAAHACRQLVFLRRTDPLIAAQAYQRPELWALTGEYTRTHAGAIRGGGCPRHDLTLVGILNPQGSDGP
jgi:hypothetical protein